MPALLVFAVQILRRPQTSEAGYYVRPEIRPIQQLGPSWIPSLDSESVEIEADFSRQILRWSAGYILP